MRAFSSYYQGLLNIAQEAQHGSHSRRSFPHPRHLTPGRLLAIFSSFLEPLKTLAWENGN